jgi:2-iminobutanoate/2-iminopropanoate deaminase
MKKKVVSSDKAPKAIAPYSQGIEAGGFIFMSGQIPLDPTTGDMVRGGIEAETRRVLDNLKAVLQSQGLDMDAVVKTTIFLADMGDFAKVNEVYGSYFGEVPPARSTIQVGALPKNARIEIEAVALRSQ